MAKHNDTGRWGENLACDMLVADGWAIVERNWRMNHLEVDIIAMKGDVLAFVEVKTRANMDEDPLEAIDRRKITNMVRAADCYIRTHDMPHQARFDLFAIRGTRACYEIEHIPDAFEPPLKTYR